MPKDLSYRQSGLTLMIPSLDVSTEIVKVPFMEGTYPVEWLDSNAGLLEGFADPGEGISIITGHNHLNHTEAGPFALLSGLEKGDRIVVLNGQKDIRIFTVYASEKIAADDIAGLEAIAKIYDNSMTLVTCEDERPEGGYAARRIVAARPVSE